MQGKGIKLTHTASLLLYLQSGKELEMLQYCEPVKEHIVLGTDPQALADLVHVGSDVLVIDHCCATRGCVQTYIKMDVIIKLFANRIIIIICTNSCILYISTSIDVKFFFLPIKFVC